jgi:nicotinamidase-related amidase
MTQITLADQRLDDAVLTRDNPFNPKRTCLLLVDTQNYVWNPKIAGREPYFDKQLRETVLPNLRGLIDACRATKTEVMYTVMENLTEDGRDRSLDYKLSKFWIGKNSWEAKVLDQLKPGHDDIVLPKTSSGVFNSTNIEYLLRNIGVDTLLITGFLTDQCVDHAVRDAADRGFYPVCVTDACASYSQERHDNAINLFKGYCRHMATAEALGWMGKR